MLRFEENAYGVGYMLLNWNGWHMCVKVLVNLLWPDSRLFEVELKCRFWIQKCLGCWLCYLKSELDLAAQSEMINLHNTAEEKYPCLILIADIASVIPLHLHHI